MIVPDAEQTVCHFYHPYEDDDESHDASICPDINVLFYKGR